MFLRSGNRHRTIHIHVGPHKTGSSAIQHDLEQHGAAAAKTYGVTPIIDPAVWALAKAMNVQAEDEVTQHMETVVKRCAGTRGDLVISCEDLAGDLPGRARSRRPYAFLWHNLNHLRRAFGGEKLKFYFFIRDPERWLDSAYAQILKYRRKFKSFQSYTEHVTGLGDLWEPVLQQPRERLGQHFVTVPYEEGGGFSATRALFRAITGEAEITAFPEQAKRLNSSPPRDVIPLLEAANRSGASHEAVQAAKLSIWNRSTHAERAETAHARPDWPPMPIRPGWLSPELEALWSRVGWRTGQQEQPNLMPAEDCDLAALRLTPVVASDELPEVSRERMEDQVKILAHQFRRMPETCALLGLVISYLRRSTGHEAQASALFQRLWEEEYPVLLGFLSTRWLISTFQTFMDHGINEEQRLIGASAFFFSNTLKLYEAERALEGLASDATYPNLVPATRSGFWGLDRFRVGGTDLMLNTNAHLLELAARDARAGRVLQEFLLRVKRGNSAFSRMDRTRLEHEIDIPPFSDCWSFFEPPKIKG